MPTRPPGTPSTHPRHTQHAPPGKPSAPHLGIEGRIDTLVTSLDRHVGPAPSRCDLHGLELTELAHQINSLFRAIHVMDYARNSSRFSGQP